MTGTISALRGTLAERRAQRLQRARLERELAAYTSSADRAELGAILSRHTDEETRELQAVLAAQAA